MPQGGISVEPQRAHGHPAQIAGLQRLGGAGMTREEETALARECFRLICQRLEEAGLKPEDPLVGKILATMVGGHFAFRGGGEELANEIIEAVADAMIRSERLIAERRRAH